MVARPCAREYDRFMTIAACYLSSEGVVLGADSTSTVFVTNPSGVGGMSHQLNLPKRSLKSAKIAVSVSQFGAWRQLQT